MPHPSAMSTRWNPRHEAVRKATWTLLELGRELRVARIRAGRTQRQIGASIGRSASRISRIEGGKVPRLPVRELIMVSAAVGLSASVKMYPARHLPLDAAQLRLIEQFIERIHARWKRRLEAVMPIAGDGRAIDLLISLDGCSCAVEAITRLVDLQAQLRSAKLKQRDIGATRLILLVRDSHANRRMIAEMLPFLGEELPIRTRSAVRSLARGEDPGGDCLILL